MTANDPELRRYFRQIGGWLPCTRKMKRKIMGQIEDRVREFLEHNPDANLARLQAEFGDPHTIAAAYVENTGTVEILRSLRVRRRIVTIVDVTAVAILLAWVAVVTWGIVDFSDTTDAPHIESTIE